MGCWWPALISGLRLDPVTASKHSRVSPRIHQHRYGPDCLDGSRYHRIASMLLRWSLRRGRAPHAASVLIPLLLPGKGFRCCLGYAVRYAPVCVST